MKQTVSGRVRAIAWLLTLVYFASYTTRINFAVMMVKICSDMSMEKTALAVVVTGLTVTYGFGQIISGYMGDKIRAERMIATGLAVACATNVLIVLCHSIVPMTLIWCVNGFAQAMLWPPIVRLLSMYLTDEEYSYAVVRVSWGSSFATVALYLLCPLLLYVVSWRVVMLLCAVVGVCVLGLWLFFNPRLLINPVAAASKPTEDVGKPVTSALPRFVYLPIVLIIAGIVLQGILRDGVTNWMPFYMQETFGIPAENAIISTVILAVFSIVSFSAFNLLHRKIFRNEVFCAAVIFAGSAACAAILYVVNLFSASVVISMLLMACIVACMHGINLMLIAVVPKRFVKSGKVSTYSDLLNAFTYVGASISTYGFAVLSSAFGWSFTIFTWIIVSAVGLAVCLVAAPLWKRFRKEYAD